MINYKHNIYYKLNKILTRRFNKEDSTFYILQEKIADYYLALMEGGNNQAD